MIISVEKAKTLITFPSDWTDEKIEMKLKAVEQTIRAYTNNNFQNRGIRFQANIANGVLMSETLIRGLKADDTIQVSESVYNKGLYTAALVTDDTVVVNEETTDESGVLVTKIEYPADVIDCCVDLMEWTAKFAGKVGIKSETLSRHSVTYEESATMFMGYPVALMGCLKPYRKARC